jgi:opacity protein-like surface antigen
MNHFNFFQPSTLLFPKILLIIFCFISFPSKIIQAQDLYSIKISGGIVVPMNSSNGLSASAQLNYSMNPVFSLYIYSGIAQWDKFKIKFYDDRTVYSGIGPHYFDSYSSDDHILIPVYIGSRINFHTNNLFTSFINFEIGYSYLSYNSYDQQEEVNPETREVVGYYPDYTTKKENRESLFGVGIGAGLSHPISKSIDLLLAFKLNSYVNGNYNGLFSTRGTYTAFIAGLNFKL